MENYPQSSQVAGSECESVGVCSWRHSSFNKIAALYIHWSNTSRKVFGFARRSSHGKSLPDWLINPGPIYLRKFVRSSKSDDLVVKVELIECNPMYAHSHYPDGRESNVSVRDLAPYYESDAASKDGSDFEAFGELPATHERDSEG